LCIVRNKNVKASLGTALSVYIYWKYPASYSNSRINFSTGTKIFQNVSIYRLAQ